MPTELLNCLKILFNPVSGTGQALVEKLFYGSPHLSASGGKSNNKNKKPCKAKKERRTWMSSPVRRFGYGCDACSYVTSSKHPQQLPSGLSWYPHPGTEQIIGLCGCVESWLSDSVPASGTAKNRSIISSRFAGAKPRGIAPPFGGIVANFRERVNEIKI